MSALIDLQAVEKRYVLYGSAMRQMLGYMGIGSPGAPIKHALSNITLSIRHGERIGIVGHNGSGKTTLLRIISGHTRPSAGEVTIRGSVQALMQRGYGFNDHLSGLENIRNALVYNGLPREELAAAEQDILDFVELGEFIHHPVKTYSLGMRARLEFAAATAIRPSILAIDEVLGAGDGYFVRKCAARMRQLMDKTTLLLVSHSLDQIVEYCERVIWLDGGRIREDGATEAVLDHYRSYMNERTQQQAVSSPAAEADSIAVDDSLFTKLHTMLGIGDQQGTISRFQFAGSSPTALATETGQPLSLSMEYTVQEGVRLQPVALGVTEDGGWVFELQLGNAGGAGTHEFSTSSAQCEIGVGRYLLLPALRDADTGRLVALGNHPLSLHMAVANWSDPPLVHFDAHWHTGNVRLASKINPWV